jgi:hypothetical protein
MTHDLAGIEWTAPDAPARFLAWIEPSDHFVVAAKGLAKRDHAFVSKEHARPGSHRGRTIDPGHNLTPAIVEAERLRGEREAGLAQEPKKRVDRRRP